MLNNLFNSFDRKNFFFSLYFLIRLYFFYIINSLIFINFINFIKNKIIYFFLIFINKNFFSFIIFISVFVINIISLNLYSFSLTRQILFNIPLILILWSPLLIINLIKKKNNFLSHLVPLNTPIILTFLIVLIELIRFFIRPLTLFLRLTINIIAGHVLITLIRNIVLKSLFFIFILISIYILLKFIVCFIQAYIIVILISIYKEEI